MRLVLKILAAPIVVALTLFVWLFSGMLYLSAFVFGLAGTAVAVLALLVLFTTSVQKGIILLVFAFLVSPMGIPIWRRRGCWAKKSRKKWSGTSPRSRTVDRSRRGFPQGESPSGVSP